MKAIVTVGISASGKTTFAKEMEKECYRDINRDWIRFNLVKPGANWSSYKFNKTNEDQVTEIQGKMIMESWSNEQNIVISDTNLDSKSRTALIKKLRDIGYEVEIHSFPVTREVAFKRDNLRVNGVGQDVIYRQIQKWNDYSGRITYVPDESLPAAIIVDVDGTVAQMNGRGPFDWHRVSEDLPRKIIRHMVEGYQDAGYIIIICSGRDEVCREDTHKWLVDNGIGFEELHMRKKDDYRKDNVVKEEIFWTHLAHRYNIVACIDDRPQMIRLWHELKIPNVIAVADPYLEF